MTMQNDSDHWSVAKFAIGQPVLRSEDPILVRGEGRFTDDVSVAGQAYAVIVRSRHAHGDHQKIDTDAARKMQGVLGVYTGADLVAAGYGTLKCIVPFKNRDGSEMKKPPRHALRDRQGALRRRPGRVRGGRDAQPGEGRRRSGRGRHRAAARRHRSGAGGEARTRRSSMTTCPATSRSTTTIGDSRAVERRVRQGRACHEASRSCNNRVVVNAMEPRAAVGELRRTAASRCTAARRACSA